MSSIKSYSDCPSELIMSDENGITQEKDLTRGMAKDSCQLARSEAPPFHRRFDCAYSLTLIRK